MPKSFKQAHNRKKARKLYMRSRRASAESDSAVLGKETELGIHLNSSRLLEQKQINTGTATKIVTYQTEAAAVCMTGEKHVMIGTLSQGQANERFKGVGLQCVANSVAALSYAQEKAFDNSDTNDINEIFIYGNKFVWCMTEQHRDDPRTLEAREIPKILEIHGHLEIH